MYLVLYVDDEESLLELGKVFLEMQGHFTIETTISALEAIEKLKTARYDAVISDYQMPEMDGIAFLKRVRSEFSDIPFILFTGKGREEVVIAAINNGADSYIQKGGDPTAQFAELGYKTRMAVERHNAEDALRNSEQRLADIINFLPDATFVINTDGIVIAWNHAIEEETGIAAADIVGKGNYEYALPFYGERRKILIDLINDPAGTIWQERYTIQKKEENVIIAETRAAQVKGVPRILLCKVSRLYNKEGRVTGAIESIRDITDAKKSEEELRAAYEQITATEEELRSQYEELVSNEKLRKESEEKYRRILENMQDAFLRVDRNGYITFVNLSAARMYRYESPEAMIGIPAASLYLHPELREKIVLKLKDSSKVNDFIGQGVRKDGTTFWASMSVQYFVDIYGEIIGTEGIIRDITERKQSEDTLRAAYERISMQEEELRNQVDDLAASEAALKISEEKFRDIVETSPDMVWEMDMQGIFTYMSPQCISLLGFTPDEITGTSVFAIVPDEAVPELRTIFDHAMKTKDPPKSFELLLRRKDGQVIVSEIRPAPKFEADGSIHGFRGLARDISEKKQADEQIQLLKTSVDQAADEVFWLDFEGTILYVNDAACRITGYSKEELTGMKIFHLDPDFSPEIWNRAIGELRMKKNQIIESRHRRKDGVLIDVEIMSAYVKKNENEYAFAFVRDITLRKKAEAELLRLNTDLENMVDERTRELKAAQESYRSANEKLNLLSTITRHDLLNQLSALRTYISISKDDAHTEALATQLGEADSIAGIMQEILEFTRMYQDIGVKSPVWQDLRETIVNVSQELLPVTVSCPVDLPGIECYADALLEKVFFTLIENALRHGKSVTTISFTSRKSDDGLVIVCQDNGIGIDTADKNKIFDRGFGNHTGLGLFLSREILAITGSTIRETGEPGKGARFEILFPEGTYRYTGKL